MTPEKRNIIIIAAVILLSAFLVVPFLFAGIDGNYVHTSRNIAAPLFYGVMLLFSVGVLIYYIFHNKRKYLWVILLFVSVVIVDTGYLALSLASNVTEALLANRISYFGNVYMLLFLLFTILNACGITYRRFIVVLLLAFSSIMFIFSATQGYLDIFYKNTDFAIVDGFARLIKEYGPMHTVYMIYIFSFVIGIAGTVIYSAVKKKLQPPKYVVALSIMAFLNIAIWFAEQFINNHIEYLAFSYAVNEIVLMWIYDRLVQNGAFNTFEIRMTIHSEDTPEKTVNIVVEESDDRQVLTGSDNGNVNLQMLSDEKLLAIVNQIRNFDKLTDREKEVAVLFIKNMKRKEVASSLFISEETVKTHTSHIFGKLEVSSRKELHQLAEECARNDVSS